MSFEIIAYMLLIHQSVAAMYNWNEIQDRSQITWAHGVNSWSALETAMIDDTQFIEADVSLGRLFGDEPEVKYPVMAHSSYDETDISFKDWVKYFIENNKRNKGMKLDFKDIESADIAAKEISKLITKPVAFPIWINADIISGIGDSNRVPVNPAAFVKPWSNLPFDCTFSLGWTTDWNEEMDSNKIGYSWLMVYAMYSAISNLKISSHHITFPVRAVYCNSKSMVPLRWLMAATPNSSLTVWGHATDGQRSIPALKTLLNNIPKQNMFFDLPALYDQELNNITVNKALPPNIPFIPSDTKNIYLNIAENQVSYPVAILNPQQQRLNFMLSGASKNQDHSFHISLKPLQNFSNFQIFTGESLDSSLFHLSITPYQIKLQGTEIKTHDLDFDKIYLYPSFEITLNISSDTQTISAQVQVFLSEKREEFEGVNDAVRDTILKVPMKGSADADIMLSLTSHQPIVCKNTKLTRFVRSNKRANAASSLSTTAKFGTLIFVLTAFLTFILHNYL